jgi:hypothetical protein
MLSTLNARGSIVLSVFLYMSLAGESCLGCAPVNVR